MSRERIKKIAKWTGIALGAVIVILGSWLGLAWFAAGSVYEGELADLIPGDAVAVIHVNQPAKALGRLEDTIDTMLVKRSNFRSMEQSPFWKSLFDENPKTAVDLSNELQVALKQASASVAAIPVLGLSLNEDFLASEMAFAMLAKGRGNERPWLALTRVSKTVDFGMGFSGWATGTTGRQTITELEGVVSIAEANKPTIHIGLRGDVLAASSDRSVIMRITGEGLVRNAFSSHPRYAAAKAKVEGVQGGSDAIKLYANLNAIRAEQGPEPNDPQQRAKIDTYFAISPEVARLSPEIMPSVSTLIQRAVDTRAFDMGAWAISLGDRDVARIDQFLLTDAARLDDEFSYLKPTWTAPAANMDFLKLLPADTWAVATNRLPFGPLRDAIKPGKNPDGSDRQDVVATFLNLLGEKPPVESVGLALFGRTLSPDPRRHADRAPPRAVSPMALPGFALFLNWPGVTTADAESLMKRTLESMKATNLYVVNMPTASGANYVAFNMRQEQELVKWLLDFGCFAVNDHLFFVYSPRHTAIQEILATAANPKRSLAEAPNTVFANQSELPSTYSALVYVSPNGMNDYSQAVGLPTHLAEQKFNPSTPNGKELRDVRMEIAARMTRERGREVDWLNPEVEEAMLEVQRKWVAQKGPFQAEFESNVSAFANLLSDFTAHTMTTAEGMHTRFAIRLK